MREIGPIDTREVKAVQESIFGLMVDGKVGNQTWGEVQRIVNDYAVCRASKSLLVDAVIEAENRARVMFLVAGAGGIIMGIALAAMFG